MKSRKRDRSPEKQAPSTDRAGSSSALEKQASVTVSLHVEQPEEPLADLPEGRSMTNRAIHSLDSILKVRLPYLEKNPLHTKSTSTRQPQYYDKHLAEALRLKVVAFMDKHFFEISSRICDQYVGRLSEYEKDILFPHTGFKLPSQDNIFDEKSLVAYCEVINRHFSRIASTLLFRTKWISVLGVSTQVDGVSSTDAAADSYLFTQWTLRRFLSSEDKPGFDLVRKYDLQVPMNWEYKNLGFGHEIFSALQTQGGDFHWTACQERSARHGATSKCPNHIHRTEGRLTITGRPTGPDALATVDIIKRSTDENVLDSGEERPTKRLRKNAKTAAEKKVQSILQQAWTSAVVQDASFIVISTGNEECFAIRHRETQRLLISPPIRPSDKTGPSYVKVCIGLFIVAYQDAVDRAQQLDSKCLSLYAQALLRLRIDDRPALPNASSSSLFDTHRVSVQILPPESYFLQLLSQSRHIDLRLHRQDLATVQYNQNTWTLSRQETDNTMALSESDLAPMSHNFVFLDLDRLFQKTSRIWRVYFGVVSGADNKTDYFEKPLVLKMARDAGEVATLKAEYDWYERLKNGGVTSIVECYGIFSCQVNAYEERYFLLLEDGGIPISNRPGTIRLGHTKKHCDSYQAAVTDVHECSFVHKNITPEHVLMGVGRGKATLISLKNCAKPNEADATFFKAIDLTATGFCLGISLQGEYPATKPVPKPNVGDGSRSQQRELVRSSVGRIVTMMG